MNAFLLNLSQRDSLTDEERDAIVEMSRPTRDLPPKCEIVSTYEKPAFSTLLVSGFAARVNILSNGSRQITAIHVPGDFVDLHSLLLAKMDHSVVTISACTVAQVPHGTLRTITAQMPHLSRMLWLLTIVDAAIYRRWLIAAGRLSAPAQIAHFVCEIYTRLRAVELAGENSFELPISQAELGDAMGLSVVHVNRSLRQLRERDLVTWEGPQVIIRDWDRLSRFCEFDPVYLSLEQYDR